MSKTWHKGPPPSVGWWPASRSRNPNMLRWWDKVWSLPVHKNERSAERVARNAATPEPRPFDIEWTDRPKSWPKRSHT